MIIQDQEQKQDTGHAGSGNMKLFELDDKLDTEPKLNFDIVDDLHIFMRNDPMFYRKEYFPSMCEMSKSCNEESFRPSTIIMPLIDKGLTSYCKKYDLAKHPNELLTKENKKNLAHKIASEEMPAIRNGDYK